LIEIDGPDGSGKSSATKKVAEAINGFYTHEPTESEEGKTALILAKSGKLKESLTYFLRDREQHFKEIIIPTLVKGQPVILDRGNYSTMVYQCVPGESLVHWRQALPDFIKGLPQVMRAHLTFILTAPIEVLKKRIVERDGKNDVLLNWGVWERFNSMLSWTRWASPSKIVIDTGELSIDEVVQIVLNHMQQYLALTPNSPVIGWDKVTEHLTLSKRQEFWGFCLSKTGTTPDRIPFKTLETLYREW